MDVVDGGAEQIGLLQGAMFVRELSSSAIFHMECVNPFKKCKVFDISHTNKEPLTLVQVPREYRPYVGCLFVRSFNTNDVVFENHL